MITAIKRAIALSVKRTLGKGARVRTSDFEAERNGRPIPEIEASVIYAGSSYDPGELTRTVPYRSSSDRLKGWRSLSYQIFLRCKNLRSEDEVQQITDLVIFDLSELITVSQPVIITSDQPLGYDEGIWTYRIDCSVTVSLAARECDVSWEDLELEAIVVSLQVMGAEDTETAIARIEPQPDPI